MAKVISEKCYARVGLMGNPSDGFGGKTLSFLINNFFAEVTLTANSDEVALCSVQLAVGSVDAFTFNTHPKASTEVNALDWMSTRSNVNGCLFVAR